MTNAQYDVAVAGGGPAGATLAGRLAQQGRRVLVLEKLHFPRFHLGESLLPRSLDVFDALGVREKLEARLLKKYGARFIDGERGDEVAFRFADAFDARYEYAFQGSRAEIDAVLLEHAGELGAEVREGWEVDRVRWEGSRAVGLVARDGGGNEVTIDARVVVDATGRHALCSRAPDARQKLPLLEDTLALYCQMDGCARLPGIDEGDIRIILVPEGWFWIIPFRGDRTSVGVVLKPGLLDRSRGKPDLEKTMKSLCDRYEPVRHIVDGAKRVMPVGAVADFSYRVREIAGNGWLALGDAAGFIDPLFSTGFHLAVRGADLAADAVGKALDTGDVSGASWAGYERAARRAAAHYVGIVQAFYRGELIPLLFMANQRLVVRRMITSALAGDVFHQEDPRWLRELSARFPATLPGEPAEGTARVAPQA